MNSMPEELLVEVVQWLPLKALANVMQTNRQFNRICRDDKLWSAHQDFPYRLKSETAGKIGSWIAANIKGEKVPPTRLCHTAVVHDGCMYVNGGHTTSAGSQMFNSVKEDLWRFNFVTKKWDEIVEPKLPKKTEHSAVMYGDKMWLFGGFSGSAFTNDVTCYDLKAGTVCNITATGDIPAPRSAHVAIASEGKMWVFGGWNGAAQNNDLYSFDFETHAWAKVVPTGPQPLPRCSHCAAYAPKANSLFIFGGCGGQMQNYLADLWQFSFDTMTWRQVGVLQPGSRMKMVEYRNRLYVYGGWNSKDHFNLFNEFDIATAKWRTLDPEFAASQGKMGQFSMVVFNHKMYKFAGYCDTAGTATNDLHAYRMGKPDFTEGAESAH